MGARNFFSYPTLNEEIINLCNLEKADHNLVPSPQEGREVPGNDNGWEGWDDVADFLPPMGGETVNGDGGTTSQDSGFAEAFEISSDHLEIEWDNALTKDELMFLSNDGSAAEDEIYFSDMEEIEESLCPIYEALSQPLCERYRNTWIK